MIVSRSSLGFIGSITQHLKERECHMTEDSTAVDQQANQPVSEVPGEQSQSGEPFMQVKYKGQDIGLASDEAARLAQKGMNYEQKMANLKQQQTAVEGQQAEVAQYQQFRQYLSSNPEKATQIEAVIRGESVPTTDELEDPDPMSATNQRLGQMEQYLGQLSQYNSTQHQQQAQNLADTTVRKAISESSLLQRSPDMAYLMLLQEMASDQTQDITVAAKVVEGKFLGLAGATPESVEQVQAQQARFGAEGGVSGSPATATKHPNELTKTDLKKGGVRKAALEFLQQMTP